MPIRLFAPGEHPSAGDFNRYFLQQHSVIKASDESVTSSTTLQSDDHLFAPVFANTYYWVWCVIFYTGSGLTTEGDMKINWNAPSGSTFNWVSDGLGSGATSSVSTLSRNAQGLGNSPAPGTVGSDTVAPIKGLLLTGGNAGTLQLTWAQNVSSTTATTVYANSTLLVRRLTI